MVGVGYARFNLNLLDGERPAVETLFAYFPYWKTTALTRLLQTLYVLLWSLLLIVPGIMAAYSYAMTEFLLADNPDLTPSEALAQSKAMMYGNRWRLFCLQISFIGWSILANITVIGGIFLTPYVETASAAFYRELTDQDLTYQFIDTIQAHFPARPVPARRGGFSARCAPERRTKAQRPIAFCVRTVPR